MATATRNPDRWLTFRLAAKIATTRDPDACDLWRGTRREKRAGTTRGVFTLTIAPYRYRWLQAHRAVLALATIQAAFGAVDITAADLLAVYDARWADGSPREAAHRCGNRLCCNPRHLYWATADENRRDRYGDRYGDRPRPALAGDADHAPGS